MPKSRKEPRVLTRTYIVPKPSGYSAKFVVVGDGAASSVRPSADDAITSARGKLTGKSVGKSVEKSVHKKQISPVDKSVGKKLTK